MYEKILVTGSGGFIGRNLVEQLKGKYEIIAPRSNELDLRDLQQVKKFLIKNKFDVVIHAANRNATRNKTTTGYDILYGNLSMFYNLIECRDSFGKMIYFGSGAEYDSRYYIPFMNESYLGQYIPQDPYGFSKYIMAKYVEQERVDNVTELVLFGVYGKYEEWERRFISNNICRNLKELPMTLNQNCYFDYLYIDDLVKIVEWFIKNKPRQCRYNVCRGEHIDLKSLADMINLKLGNDRELHIAKEGFKKEYSGSNASMLKEIGNFHFTSYEQGIDKLCEFYKKNLDKIDVDKL